MGSAIFLALGKIPRGYCLLRRHQIVVRPVRLYVSCGTQYGVVILMRSLRFVLFQTTPASSSAGAAEEAAHHDTDDFLWVPSEEGMANGMPKTLTILQVA